MDARICNSLACVLWRAVWQTPADKLEAITKAAGVNIESIYFTLFAKAFEGKDVNELLLNVGSASAAPAAGAVAASADAPAAAEEKKEESDEESDEDMGMGLFD
ncbi:hypothetical protein IW139_000650 [Coemansia sp. RSA 353]|nr:hypothetical protein IW139_000650 [Coemansia sp. RSA 353]